MFILFLTGDEFVLISPASFLLALMVKLLSSTLIGGSATFTRKWDVLHRNICEGFREH